jgi:hypothetical protein
VKTPSAKLIAEWNKKLKESGFVDIESPDRLFLKNPSIPIEYDLPNGKTVNITDLYLYQEENTEIQSSWPEPIFSQPQNFQNHPDFDLKVEEVCNHKNVKFNPIQAAQIWNLYVEGVTWREIAKQIGIHESTVSRVIIKLTEIMNLTGEPPPMDNVKVVVRQFDPIDDTALIYSTWRNALWYDHDQTEKDSTAFYRASNAMIKRTLALPNVEVKIACNQDSPTQIVGYAVMQSTNVIFTYVKIDFRNQGIAAMLTKGFVTISTPETVIGKAIKKDKNLKEKTNG